MISLRFKLRRNVIKVFGFKTIASAVRRWPSLGRKFDKIPVGRPSRRFPLYSYGGGKTATARHTHKRGKMASFEWWGGGGWKDRERISRVRVG